MHIELGSWIVLPDNEVHRVANAQGKGRNQVFVTDSGVSVFAQDCIPYTRPLDDFEEMKQMIDLADDSSAIEVYQILKTCFASDEGKQALWRQLSASQRSKVKKMGAIALGTVSQVTTGA